ncbi:MAG: hypothetical protein ACRCXA_02765 [Peptostreptococcaceae bacterium]
MEKYNNEELTYKIISMFKENSIKEYNQGNTKREAHPKCLGLLKGYFVVNEDLEDKYKVGIFKSEKIYPAFIRISSSNPKVKSDKSKDLRGFSIKLLNVDGKKCAKDEKHTQDFVLISNETMPIGNLKLFYDSIYYMNKSNLLMVGIKLLMHNNLSELIKTMRNLKHESSPLDISYYSTTPYLYGKRIVKYKIEPKSFYKSETPKKLSENYLTDNMQKHLQKDEAVFDFLVQFWMPNKKMPINNASIKWREESSSYIKLGQIIIPKQIFNTKERFEAGEGLSFSPGHARFEHRPIGDINEARVKIYEEMSKFRHDRNNKIVFEPDEKYFYELK